MVAGGGTALVRARAAVRKVVDSLTGDEATGARTVWESLTAPARLIADNAGLEGAVTVRQLEDETGSMGLNAATGEFVDMFKPGSSTPPRSPVRRCRTRRRSRRWCSPPSGLVADKPEKSAPAMPGGGGMGGMGGMPGMM